MNSKKFKNYNGNIVRNFHNSKSKKLDFSEQNLNYSLIKLSEGETYTIDFLNSFVIYLIDNQTAIQLEIMGKNNIISSGDSLKIINEKITVKAKNNLYFLIAGTKITKYKKKLFKITKYIEHYKVTKPWGYEVWISGECNDFAFKKIYLKKNYKTSLQFHEYKEEINLLFDGNIKLVYQDINNLKFLKEKALTPLSTIYVKPKIVHRIMAISDSTLYEISTPFLDDVIRISDDFNRHDGRINSEHSN